MVGGALEYDPIKRCSEGTLLGGLTALHRCFSVLCPVGVNRAFCSFNESTVNGLWCQ